MTLSAHRISTEDRRENIDSMIYQMEYLEQEKVKANSNYRRAQNSLLSLIECYELPSRKEILAALGSLDKWSEIAIKILYTLSDLYFKCSQLDKGHMIVEEMERIEEDYTKVSEVAWDYLNLLKSSNSPGLSQRTHKIGTSLKAGMLKQYNHVHSCAQAGLCANIEQNKQQYRDVSVKSGLIETSHIHNTFYCNRQSDTTVQISSTSNQTETKLGGNIESDVMPTTLTCKAVDKTTSGTEGKKRKYQGSSAYNESASLMSHQNGVRRSAEYAEAVHLQVAIPRVVRETNYNICQYNLKRPKTRKTSKFSKRSKSRKRYMSRKRSKYGKRSKFRKRYKFRKKTKSRESMKRSKLSVRSKYKKRLGFRTRSKSRKRFRSKKRAKSIMRYKSNIWSKLRKRSESRKMSWKMSRSWKRCKPRKQSKSKNQSKSRKRSKSKKGSVQPKEDEESCPWVKCTSRSSRVPVLTSYIDEIEPPPPLLGSLVCFTRTIFTESSVHTRNTPLVINCIAKFYLMRHGY